MQQAMRLMTRGTWPGPLTLRRGWARAEARPWNDASTEAHLRLIRGSATFIGESASHLLECGAGAVLSPPLPATAQRPWRAAGFDEYASLSLLRLELAGAPPPPDHVVCVADQSSLDEACRIDSAAFDPFWRMDRTGLQEAMQATPESQLLGISNGDGGLAAFAIIGFGSALAYLQRLAVDPPWQGQGMGRSVVRTAARKARAHGASAVLLNTQVENVAALDLYASEGFVTLQQPLSLLRMTG